MDFYTKEWNDYIYKYYYKYIHDYKYHISQKHYIIEKNYNNETIENYKKNKSEFLTFKGDKSKDEYLKNAIAKEEMLKYTADLLLSEFEEYYKQKKSYLKNISKKFTKYEKVKLLPYQEELKEYKKRINRYAEKLQEESKIVFNKIKKQLSEENALNNKGLLNLNNHYDIKNTKITFERIDNFDDIDYRLIALNKCPNKYQFLYENLNITNEVNGFLTGYSYYLEQRKDKFDYALLKKIDRYDGWVIESTFNEEKGHINGTI